MNQNIEKQWEELDEEVREALEIWFNSRVLDSSDKKLLLELNDSGEFVHYACAHCDAAVHYGLPLDWGCFQGVNEQKGIGQVCENCYRKYQELAELVNE